MAIECQKENEGRTLIILMKQILIPLKQFLMKLMVNMTLKIFKREYR